jgi:hypothetical protein
MTNYQHHHHSILSNQIVVQIDQKNHGPYGPQLAISMSDIYLPQTRRYTAAIARAAATVQYT